MPMQSPSAPLASTANLPKTQHLRTYSSTALVDRQIVECAKDRLWGTGVTLHRDDALDDTMWTTPGILGAILMDVREQLRNQALTTTEETMDAT